jgi:hypothetical protein
MENKKSFILYADVIHTAEKLPDKDAGELFKHILRYVNDLEPETDNLLVQLTFEPIKQQLKRDLEKWNGSRERRAEAGRKGGKARALKQKQAMLEELEANQANQADNGTVNGTVNGIVIEEKHMLLDEGLNRTFEEFIQHRKQLKKPMTMIAITRMKAKLNRYEARNAEAMLLQSMEQGWSGIFELKSNENEKGKTRAEQALENIGNNGNLDSLEGLGSF